MSVMEQVRYLSNLKLILIKYYPFPLKKKKCIIRLSKYNREYLNKFIKYTSDVLSKKYTMTS